MRILALKKLFSFCHKAQKIHTNEHFCQKVLGQKVPNYNKKFIEFHDEINQINPALVNPSCPVNLDETFIDGCIRKITGREMITRTDFQFRSLIPTEQEIISYRGISKKPDFFKVESKLYKKILNCKKNDIITMNEYAYSAEDIEYAKRFAPNDEGILYRMKIPPKARVSRYGGEIVFPRNSKFKVLNKEKQGNLTIFDVEYILPQEPFRTLA